MQAMVIYALLTMRVALPSRKFRSELSFNDENCGKDEYGQIDRPGCVDREHPAIRGAGLKLALALALAALLARILAASGIVPLPG